MRVIDEQAAETKRTYPVVLHPRTLHVLASLGVTAPLEWRGRFIKHVAVYVDGSFSGINLCTEAPGLGASRVSGELRSDR